MSFILISQLPVLLTMNKYINAVSINLKYFVINAAFFILATPFAIRLMGSEFYGLWSILYALVLLSNVGTLGIGSIVLKFGSESHGEIPTKGNYDEIVTAGVLIVLPMAAVVSLGLFLARDLLAVGLVAESVARKQFSGALMLVAISMFPQFLTEVIKGFLLSQLRNGTVRRIDMFSSVVLWLGVMAIVLLWGKNMFLVGFWCLINSSLVLILHVMAVRRFSVFHIQLNRKLIIGMLRLSGFMFFESAAITLFQQFDRVIVGLVLGPAAAGVYSVSTSVGTRLTILTNQVTDVMLPYASLKAAIKERIRLYAVFRKLSKFISLNIAVVGSLLILWIEFILSLWISPDYASRYSDVFSVVIISYCFLTLSRPAHKTLTGLGKIKLTSLVYVASTIATLGGIYLFSRGFGLIGTAWANGIMTLLLIYCIYTYTFLGGGLAWRSMISDMHWGLFLPGVLYALKNLNDSFWFKGLLTAVPIAVLVFVLWMDDWSGPIIRRRVGISQWKLLQD